MINYNDWYDKVASDKRFNPNGPTLMQRKSEICWLLNLVSSYGGVSRCVEIGSLYGANLALLSLITNDSLISIEPEIECELRSDIVSSYLTSSSSSYTHLKNYTTDDGIVDRVIAAMGGSDPRSTLVLVDGLHGTEPVLYDVSVAMALIQGGGYIAIHDIAKPSVKVAWDMLKIIHPEYLEYIDDASAVSVINSGQDGWGGIGVIRI